MSKWDGKQAENGGAAERTKGRGGERFEQLTRLFKYLRTVSSTLVTGMVVPGG